MERHGDAWYAALDAYIGERMSMPFEWGTNDCCTFAADWARRVNGVDPMADLRGLAGHSMAAARVLAGEGGLLAAVTRRMGQPFAGAFAQAGDVAMVTHGGRQSMGVCTGAGIAVPGEWELVIVPITMAEAAWRVS